MPDPAACVAAVPDKATELAKCRRRIDDIDRQMLELLNLRAETALEIGGIKRRHGLPVLAPQREQKLLAQVEAMNPGPLPPAAARHIFSEIVSACRALQEPLKVAFLGPELTFSHQAVRRYFGASCDLAPQATVSEVFKEVARGRVPLGMVPVENSCEGGVGETMDQLLITDLLVCGEVCLPVSQSLMAACASHEIKTVYSHPVALAQCRNWLQSNLPGIQLIAASSTAEAVHRAASESGTGALGSELAADSLGLVVLASDVQDTVHNTTRFLVIGSLPCPPSGDDKTSLILTLDHSPGSLHHALGVLAARGLNLNRLESRPSKLRPFEYAFFADLDGHREDAPVAEALKELTACITGLKVLGSYPAGRQQRRNV